MSQNLDEISMAFGRPTKYKVEFCQQLIDFIKDGHSNEAFCAVIGICEDTFYRWRREKLDFSEAYKIGNTARKGWFKEKARENLENKNFNPVLWSMQVQPYGINTRDCRVDFSLNTELSLTDQCKQVVEACSNGALSIEQMQSLLSAIKDCQQISMQDEIVNRLSAIEEKLNAR